MFTSDTDIGRGDTRGRPAKERGSLVPASGSFVDPVELVRALWARRVFIIAMTVLGAIVGIGIALSTPKLYTATTQVLLDPRDIRVLQNEVTPNTLPSEAALALIESQISVILSNSMLTRVVEQEDLTADPEFNGTMEAPVAELIDRVTSLFSSGEEAQEARFLVTLANLRRSLSVYRHARSFVIDISVQTRNAEKSARLSRAVADAFVDDLARSQSDVARRTSDALSSRLAELREDVSEAERAVERYKSENQLVGVGGRLVDDEYIMRVNERLSSGRTELSALRVRANQMAQANVDDVVQGSFPEELSSPTLTRLRSNYSELEQQAAVLRSRLGPRHPQRIAAEEGLASVRSAIRTELDRIVESAQTEVRRAEQTNAQLTSEFETLKTQQLGTSASFVTLRELEREVEASRAVYEAFLLRARETGEQEQLSTANVRIISEATPPLLPSSMSRKYIVAGGAIIGFALGVGIAFLQAFWIMMQRGRRTKDEALAAEGQALGMYAAPPIVPVAVSSVPAGTATAGVSAGAAAASATLVHGLKPSVHADASDWRSSPRSIPDDSPRSEADSDDAEEPGAEDPQTAETSIAQSEPATEKSVRPGPDGPLPFDPGSRLVEAPTLDAAAEHEGGKEVEKQEPEADHAEPDPEISEVPRRVSLRERVRELAARAPAAVPQDGSGRRQSVQEDSEDVERLQDEIAAVKERLAAIRKRRAEV